MALLFAATLTVNSPMVTLALLTETRAIGPAGQDDAWRGAGGGRRRDPALHRGLQPGAGESGRRARQAPREILRRLLREVLGSILAGAVIGGVLTLYLRFVKRELVVFAVVRGLRDGGGRARRCTSSCCSACWWPDSWSRMWRRSGPSRWWRALHQMAVPVFVIFFAIAGAELHVRSSPPCGRWCW